MPKLLCRLCQQSAEHECIYCKDLYCARCLAKTSKWVVGCITCSGCYCGCEMIKKKPDGAVATTSATSGRKILTVKRTSSEDNKKVLFEIRKIKVDKKEISFCTACVDEFVDNPFRCGHSRLRLDPKQVFTKFKYDPVKVIECFSSHSLGLAVDTAVTESLCKLLDARRFIARVMNHTKCNNCQTDMCPEGCSKREYQCAGECECSFEVCRECPLPPSNWIAHVHDTPITKDTKDTKKGDFDSLPTFEMKNVPPPSVDEDFSLTKKALEFQLEFHTSDKKEMKEKKSAQKSPSSRDWFKSNAIQWQDQKDTVFLFCKKQYLTSQFKCKSCSNCRFCHINPNEWSAKRGFCGPCHEKIANCAICRRPLENGCECDACYRFVCIDCIITDKEERALCRSCFTSKRLRCDECGQIVSRPQDTLFSECHVCGQTGHRVQPVSIECPVENCGIKLFTQSLCPHKHDFFECPLHPKKSCASNPSVKEDDAKKSGKSRKIQEKSEVQYHLCPTHRVKCSMCRLAIVSCTDCTSDQVPFPCRSCYIQYRLLVNFWTPFPQTIFGLITTYALPMKAYDTIYGRALSEMGILPLIVLPPKLSVKHLSIDLNAPAVAERKIDHSATVSKVHSKIVVAKIDGDIEERVDCSKAGRTYIIRDTEKDATDDFH